MSEIAKAIIFFGIVLVIVGGLMLAAGKIPWIGRLPGDFMVKKENFTFYLPLTTSVLLSIGATIILFLLNRK